MCTPTHPATHAPRRSRVLRAAQVRDHLMWAANPMHFQRAGPESALGRAHPRSKNANILRARGCARELATRAIVSLWGRMCMHRMHGRTDTGSHALLPHAPWRGHARLCMCACLCVPAGQAGGDALPRRHRALQGVAAHHAALRLAVAASAARGPPLCMSRGRRRSHLRPASRRGARQGRPAGVGRTEGEPCPCIVQRKGRRRARRMWASRRVNRGGSAGA